MTGLQNRYLDHISGTSKCRIKIMVSTPIFSPIKACISPIFSPIKACISVLENEMIVFYASLCTLFRLNWAKQTPGIMRRN